MRKIRTVVQFYLLCKVVIALFATVRPTKSLWSFLLFRVAQNKTSFMYFSVLFDSKQQKTKLDLFGSTLLSAEACRYLPT